MGAKTIVLVAVQLVESLEPDVVVLDLRLPGLGGLEVAREVGLRSPRTRVVILSVHIDDISVMNALRNGAAGYIPKTASADELIRAIRHVAAGGHYLSPPICERVIQSYVRDGDETPRDAYETLTARERQVMHLVVEGYTSREAASRLSIGRRTVEMHRANLMHKLSLRNQAELIRYALRRGVLSLEGGSCAE